MNIKIYDEQQEDTLRLKLIRNFGDDTIVLAVVDKDGEMRSWGRLLKIMPTGEFKRMGSVNRSFGLPLDNEYITIIDE